MLCDHVLPVATAVAVGTCAAEWLCCDVLVSLAGDSELPTGVNICGTLLALLRPEDPAVELKLKKFRTIPSFLNASTQFNVTNGRNCWISTGAN